jgi:polysaccharide pyruvyl transferase WcaK-like protein/glycosyltransferase involved in cell wall biosynthesis
MKRPEKIKRRIQGRMAMLASRTASLLPGPANERRTLLVPPTTPGSLGDEAMMIVCMEHLQGQGRAMVIADFKPGDCWPGEPPGTVHIDLSGFFGTAHLRSLPRVIEHLRRCDRVWCLGADVMDGHYSEVGSLRRLTLLRLAADLGLEVSILGFSLNEAPSEVVLSALRDLPGSVEMCARDPKSHERAVERLGRPVKLVADVAFGLRTPIELGLEEREAIAWIHNQQAQGHRVVGLNVSHRAFKATGHDEALKVISAYRAALGSLLRRRPDVSIICIPHDYRASAAEMSDQELLTEILANVDPAVGHRTYMPGFRLSSPFAKLVAGEAYAVLSGRMHLVIAALGQGTPAAGISYQGKLAGLYEHFGLRGLEIDPSAALTASGVLRVFDRLLEDNAALSVQIAKAKPAIESLQRGNFEVGFPASGSPRLLVISPEPTHPTNKGNRVRIMDLCTRAEGLGWEVHLAHIERVPADRALMRAHWGLRYHPLPYRHTVGIHQRVARQVRGALTGNYELGIDDWYDSSIEDHLRALHRRYRFDGVMVEYVHQSKAFEVFGKEVLKILDTHDELANRFARQAAFGRRRAGFSTTAEEESIGLSRADVVLAIQDLERQRFQSRTTSEVVTVGHHVELVPPTPKPFEGRILFLGSRNQANADGIEHFLEAVWPLISDRARLLIAGSICEVIEVPEEVEQMPIVEALSMAYDQADLVIVPIRFGTGLKIKTIEALGRAKPTVSTRVGAEGLEAGHGEAILIADEPSDFAATILALLDDAELREALSRAGYELARKWNARTEAAFARVLSRVGFAQAAD